MKTGRDNTHGSNDRLQPARSRLAWFPSLAMNLVSFFADAGAGGSAQPYSDIAPPCGGSPTAIQCCHLACPDKECSYTHGDKSDFTCPEGYHKTLWTCFEGTKQIACGECATGATCWSGPWACSIWYYTGGTKC